MDSQAIVNTMEVLETKPINELVTEATIKVCYVSETPNPNATVINKEVGRQIASTLPGAPVVGFFDESTGDFVEHSRKIVIKDGNVEFKDLTRPYGFVSFEQPWYQDFMENGEVRTYLMCKAYLWTRQYKEASLALDKGQSMELDEDSMSGYYEGDVFVFTQATLDRLCILGDAYAPCFEGARIMTTYAKQYDLLANQVENIIGRRYYVMNGQLVQKPEKITLEYALQLGWNLTDAVWMQLDQRGAAGKYDINGIYTEDGETFVILQDRETLEYVRVSLEITGEDTVILGTEMHAVKQSWTSKDPVEPASVEPLGDPDPVVASASAPTEPTPAPTPAPAPASVASTYTGEPASDPVEPVTEPMTEPVTNPVVEPTTEPVVEPTVDPAAPVVEPVAEPVTEPVVEPTTEPVTEPVAEPAAEPVAEPVTEPVAEPAAEPVAEPATSFTAEPTAEPVAEPVAEPAAPAIDYVSQNAELNAQVESLNQQIADKDARISDLEGQLAEYHKKDQDMENQKKDALVTSYSAMLSAEEIAPIVEKKEELSLEEMESKFAVMYARKQQAVFAANSGMQVNVGALTPESDNLPDFMKQAINYEKQHQLTL